MTTYISRDLTKFNVTFVNYFQGTFTFWFWWGWYARELKKIMIIYCWGTEKTRLGSLKNDQIGFPSAKKRVYCSALLYRYPLITGSFTCLDGKLKYITIFFSDIGIHFYGPSDKLSSRVILTLQTLVHLRTKYIFQIFILSWLHADSIL